MKLDIRYRSSVDLGQPAMQAELRHLIENNLCGFPVGGEGVITLGGVEHHFTYMVEGEVVKMFVQPRDIAEALLTGARHEHA
jgi:hypothetical protein